MTFDKDISCVLGDYRLGGTLMIEKHITSLIVTQTQTLPYKMLRYGSGAPIKLSRREKCLLVPFLTTGYQASDKKSAQTIFVTIVLKLRDDTCAVGTRVVLKNCQALVQLSSAA